MELSKYIDAHKNQMIQIIRHKDNIFVKINHHISLLCLQLKIRCPEQTETSDFMKNLFNPILVMHQFKKIK